MTTLSYEWTGNDGSKKMFNTFPEATEWKQANGGTVKQITNFTPSKEVEHCIMGAATAGRWKNYKF